MERRDFSSACLAAPAAPGIAGDAAGPCAVDRRSERRRCLEGPQGRTRKGRHWRPSACWDGRTASWAIPRFAFRLPGYLEDAAKMLRMVGQGGRIDELVTAMNRAAEQAVPAAKDLLVNAVRTMSVADAKGILVGGDTSVTQFFASKTRAPLTEKFLPVVTYATVKVKLAEKYNSISATMGGRSGRLDNRLPMPLSFPSRLAALASAAVLAACSPVFNWREVPIARRRPGRAAALQARPRDARAAARRRVGRRRHGRLRGRRRHLRRGARRGRRRGAGRSLAARLARGHAHAAGRGAAIDRSAGHAAAGRRLAGAGAARRPRGPAAAARRPTCSGSPSSAPARWRSTRPPCSASLLRPRRSPTFFEGLRLP